MLRYHILNGDSLRDSFPDSLEGKIIVARECLVDGDVSGETLDELFVTRSKFIGGYDDEFTEADYFEKSVTEFHKIIAIPEGSEVNLWFEDDLFCQVNLWFVLYLLSQNNKACTIYLIRPTTGLQFGFGGMKGAALVSAFEGRIQIPHDDMEVLGKLWNHYQKNDAKILTDLAMQFGGQYPFLLPAVRAHVERTPGFNGVSRPEQVLMDIMDEQQTKEFVIVFREFCKREPIYGFGDLQVQRMLNNILKKQ